MAGRITASVCRLICLALCLLAALVCFSFSACADEAENITSRCTVKLSVKNSVVKRVTDGDYRTYWESGKVKHPAVTIHSDEPVYGLYLCFQKKPEKYEIQRGNGEKIADGDTRFHHVFYALNGEKSIRIQATDPEKTTMGFNEIFVFGEGEIPAWVQRWEDPPEKAEIMFLVAHPDDELLFMGGAIATTALVDQKTLQVVYLTPSNTTRRSEALNGLWTLGIRTYPEFGPFSDRYAKTGKLQDSYDQVTGGKKEVWRWVTEVFRKYQPEVVVTHDLKGEYGHPQHKMIADSAIRCYDLASQADQYPESAETYGAWQVKKLYVHLYGDEPEQTCFDFTVPRAEFGGLTGNELAQKAYEMHVTQEGMGKKYGGKMVLFSVEEYGVKRYPANRYGLYYSAVGPDVAHDSFFEHLEQTGASINE